MAKRLTKEEKIDQAIKDLINEMFRTAGHAITFDDIKDRKDDWFCEYTMTEEQQTEWKRWGKKYLMKKLNMRAARAEKEMMWVNLQWGLRLDPSPFDKYKQDAE